MSVQHAKGWAFPADDRFMVGEMKDDGTYQASHYRACQPFIIDWSLAVDAGAHVGCWSRLMSADFARVIAVEPSADTYEALVENLCREGCANVEARHIALGAKAHEVGMVLDGRGAAMHNSGARRVVPSRQSREHVACEPIDAWALPSLGFLKLDIEGSEVDALLGAQATITRCRPLILFENKGLWRRYGHRADAPQQVLTGLGYHEVGRASCDAIWGPAS